MTDLRIRIGFREDTTPEEADEHTRDLLELLEGVDAERVGLDTAPRAVSERARAGDLAVVGGAIIMAGVAVRQAAPHIAAVVQEWLRTRAQKSVTIENGATRLTVQGHTRPEEIERMVSSLARLDTGSRTERPREGDGPVEGRDGAEAEDASGADGPEAAGEER
ncbi:hypothetical protein O4J56_08370 [Nocardiopsis sp. RSe5-2]|uniref:Uncharacterized protein n=1 Tax=Nocardiopsis endophytica TaxID=3018445 RepID=A0ABT4U138_9ACTN|nr:hypothetical protein [Nocardiopsis endophytica]MDA2810646.1 hypothetical protein [Nocardiopsis endophytica]